ncbi:M16 family metallopeptidase [Roseibium sp.]|uniref:M16 family metallopeptidase n=1 Tax=Roseibium sp. TaxID=1936156 RepID=UPI003B511268
MQNRLIRATASLAAVTFVTLLALTRLGHAVEVEKVVSPQGIEAWLVEDHTVPIIAMNFSFDGGSTQDPIGKEGLTRLLAATLDEGAGDLTSEDFQGKMEELAVSVSFSTGRDRFYGSLRTLRPMLPEATELLSLAVNAPRFDESPVERMKIQLTTQIKRNESSPSAIAGRQLADFMFSDHPYARPTLGTVDTMGALQPDDLRVQHAKILTRRDLKIGVVGAIDAESLAQMLDKVFASLPEQSELVDVAELMPQTGSNLHREFEVPQTTILLALPGLKRDDPDYQAAYVMNHILGGGTFTSWMYQEVREKRGLSYGASTSLSPYRHTGLLIGSAATKSDRADETVDVMLEQLQRMATAGPTKEELDAAKRFITGSYALRFDTSGKIARQLVALQNADLGIDYFDRRNSEIEAITLEDVQRVAKRLLAEQEPTIVTVGTKKS